MSDTFDWQALSSSGTPEPPPAAGAPPVDAPRASAPPAGAPAARAAGTKAPAREPAADIAVSSERLTEALELLQGVAGGLAGLRAQLAVTQDATLTATSGGRHVTVTRKRSGSGLAVQLDERWLESAHERIISRELLEALQAAHDEAARPAAVLADDGPIAQLRALTASPASLLGWLGLPLPPV